MQLQCGSLASTKLLLVQQCEAVGRVRRCCRRRFAHPVQPTLTRQYWEAHPDMPPMPWLYDCCLPKLWMLCSMHMQNCHRRLRRTPVRPIARPCRLSKIQPYAAFTAADQNDAGGNLIRNAHDASFFLGGGPKLLYGFSLLYFHGPPLAGLKF